MSAPPTLTVLSLGGGVQSSVMALMAGESLPPTGSGGAFGRVPDCALFVDTRWEPPSVYEHLEWLEGPAELSALRRGQQAKPPRGTGSGRAERRFGNEWEGHCGG